MEHLELPARGVNYNTHKCGYAYYNQETGKYRLIITNGNPNKASEVNEAETYSELLSKIESFGGEWKSLPN